MEPIPTALQLRPFSTGLDLAFHRISRWFPAVLVLFSAIGNGTCLNISAVKERALLCTGVHGHPAGSYTWNITTNEWMNQSNIRLSSLFCTALTLTHTNTRTLKHSHRYTNTCILTCSSRGSVLRGVSSLWMDAPGIRLVLFYQRHLLWAFPSASSHTLPLLRHSSHEVDWSVFGNNK